MYPSAVDPAGLLMLESIREIFYTAQIRFELINFIAEEINGPNDMIHCIENERKTPVVAPLRFCPPMINLFGFHAMVATGIKSEVIGRQGKEYLQCKNSHRDDTNQSGIFQTFIL